MLSSYITLARHHRTERRKSCIQKGMELNYKLLDHGYVKLIEHYGSDSSIVEAARMSTDKGFMGWDHNPKCASFNVDIGDKPDCNCDGKGDEALLKYLYTNKHATPFEMAGLIIEVKAPIFVFREWHRHRTQSYNEMSARYIPLPDENYMPTIERLMMNSKDGNKQAGAIKGSLTLTEINAGNYHRSLIAMYKDQQLFYEHTLQMGIPKELARIHLPVGRYSKMRANANLRNWLAFLTLRMDVKAQWEIRQYAIAVGEIISQLYPRTWKLFIGK